MRRAAIPLCSVAAFALTALANGSHARADVVLHDADGWRVYTTGRADGHYQMILGDGDPNSHNKLVGGQLQFSSQDPMNHVVDSRIRGGFVSTNFGFGISKKFSETLEGKAFISIWLDGIDSHKGPPPQNKDVDVREGWGALSGPAGTFLFGRTYTIFGSASYDVNAYAYEFAVGNPCLADSSTIACGSVGAGPLYAAPNAQLRYTTPRMAGVEIQAALVDPLSVSDYQITRYPRLDGDVNYLLPFGEDGKLIIEAQAFGERLARSNGDQTGTVSTTAWGAMGVARVEVAGLRVGGGAWTGKGIGVTTPFQQEDQGKPLAIDQSAGGGVLRNSRGLFVNAAYDYHGTGVAVGGGNASVQETAADAATVAVSVLRQNLEYHVVLTRRIYQVILSAEFMRWRSEWYLGEVQNLNFIGAGSTFVW